MKVLPISTAFNNGYNSQQRTILNQKCPITYDSVSFGSRIFTKARKIEKSFAKQGMECEFHNNAFVAECVQKITDVFEELFGGWVLPDVVKFEPLENDNVLGICTGATKKIVFNSNRDCFYDFERLKEHAENAYNFLLSDTFSSLHPAHVFVHEFSHQAHWAHLESLNGRENAMKVWNGLLGVGVPTAIGRLITRCKLGNYAVDGEDMCEFLAERMTQDICDGMSEESWIMLKNVDVNYSDIFNRKWNYRYSSPQSYIDYFTQQVWNGNISEAIRAGEMAEQYLQELDAAEVLDTIAYTQEITEEVPVLETIANFLGNINRRIRERLDQRNRIRINQG